MILQFQDWGERLVGFREQIFYSVFFPSRLGVANSKLLLSAEKMGSEEKTRIADLESGLLDRVAGGSGDYYVGLAESPEAAVTNRERRALRIASTVFITICCILAALYGGVSLYPRIEALVTKGAVPGTFSFNSLLSSMNLRGEEALQQQPHRTSYHYQPAKNWMNGKPKELVPPPHDLGIPCVFRILSLGRERERHDDAIHVLDQLETICSEFLSGLKKLMKWVLVCCGMCGAVGLLMA